MATISSDFLSHCYTDSDLNVKAMAIVRKTFNTSSFFGVI
ncbi:hypothetical protein FHX64_001837 [Microbacter margulisiae]|uniref:Uncharacterized protein n=1 Tax=Microbacter margulisiae TaxID=1350067 RepID=A0A7W5DSA5_9PORP|nr:hypothetical protein [Microbacter margulisiae]